jgi:hypothetical protein
MLVLIPHLYHDIKKNLNGGVYNSGHIYKSREQTSLEKIGNGQNFTQCLVSREHSVYPSLPMHARRLIFLLL